MKRALTGFVAAGIALGMMAPAAFASTSSITWAKKNIQFSSYTANGVSGYAENGTTYMPVYYVLQALKNSGYTYTFDGKVLNITTPSGVTPDTSNLTLGSGNLTIEINGAAVKMVNTEAHKDPAGGANAAVTTYIPIYYIQQILDAVNFHNTWDGTNWQGQQLTVASVTGNNSVGIGGKDSLALTLKDAAGNVVTPKNVTWSVSGTGAVVDPSTGSFIASQAGTYTVTADVDGVQVSGKVVVYGDAAALTATAQKSTLVANGESTTTITVTAVDANGNPALNYNGKATVSTSGSVVSVPTASDVQAADYSSADQTVTFKNGVATLVVQAGTLIAQSQDVTFTSADLTDANGAAQTAKVTLNTVAQVATAVKVTAPSNQYVEANNSWNEADFNVEVVDQDGQPMLTGSYALTANLAGVGQFADGTTGPENYVFTGTGIAGTTNDVTIPVYSIASKTGSIGLAVSGTGLSTGSASVQAVISGVAAKLTATENLTSFAQGGSVVLTVGQADAMGYPTQETETPNYNVVVKDSSGKDVTSSFTVSGQNSDTITINTAGKTAPLAGTYTVYVSDGNTGGKLAAAAPVTFTVTPDQSAPEYAFASSALQVAASSPSTSFKVSAVDQYGNALGEGATLYLKATAANAAGNTGTATVNGTTVASGDVVKVTTDANGVATVNFSAQPYTGTVWTFTLNGSSANQAADGTAITTAYNSESSTAVTLETTVATSISSSVVNTGSSKYAGSASAAQAGDTLSLTLTAKDQYGSPTGSDTVVLTPSSGLDLSAATGGSIQNNGDGTYTVTLASGTATISGITATGAGGQTIGVKDTSAPTTPSTTQVVSVVAGGFDHYAVFDASGKLLSTNSTSQSDDFAPNTPVQVWVKPVDQYNNPVTNVVGHDVVLSSNASFSDFRMTAAGTDVAGVWVPAGSNGVAVYYINGDSQAEYNNLTAAAATAASFTVAPTSATISAGATTQVVTVTVLDSYGNPVAGAPVNFTVAAGTDAGTVGTLSAASAVTNASGVATVTYTQGTGAAGTTDVVTATVAGATTSAGTSTITHS